MLNLNEYLDGLSYPGRGIVLGRSPDGTKTCAAYFIMGRSFNSRNRVFETTEDGIRTKAFDESRMTDPSLIIYRPVRRCGGCLIVTNGDQTDTIAEALAAGGTFEGALRTRTFEPDGPNWTPRISGLVCPDGTFRLSILKSLEGDPSCCCRYFYEYDSPRPGTGHILHTYQENREPLPPFQGEPRLVEITAPDAGTWAREIWDHLNEDNRVSLYVTWFDPADGSGDSVIINRHGA